MSIILNGTTLDSSANITYNGTSLSKVIYNGVTVWTKEATMPTKGRLITIDNNILNKYLVLKTNGNIAEIITRDDYKTNQVFSTDKNTVTFADGSTGLKYADSDIDVLLNTTYYNSLSSTVRNAIVPKNITQDMWTLDYKKYTTSSNIYAEQLKDSDNIFVTISGDYGTAPIGDRNVYILSITEIFECLDVRITDSDKINDMFWRRNSGIDYDIWLRSTTPSESAVILQKVTKGFYVTSYTGKCSIRPVFQIDLSQVAWKYA